MISIQEQLVHARIGQDRVLGCKSEAFPKSINYWTKDKTEIIAQGEASLISYQIIQNSWDVPDLRHHFIWFTTHQYSPSGLQLNNV